MIAATDVWEVFARQDAEIPLRHIGRVDATSVDDALVFASTLYQEWKWTDMYIVPLDAVHQVVKPA